MNGRVDGHSSDGERTKENKRQKRRTARGIKNGLDYTPAGVCGKEGSQLWPLYEE